MHTLKQINNYSDTSFWKNDNDNVGFVNTENQLKDKVFNQRGKELKNYSRLKHRRQSVDNIVGSEEMARPEGPKRESSKGRERWEFWEGCVPLRTN